MTTLMGMLGSMNANQVTIQAMPVTTQNEVYDAYLQYLRQPGSLIISDDPPPKAPPTFARDRAVSITGFR